MILKSLIVGPLEVNCYILACERTGEGIVIDPGDEPQEILSAIAEEGISIREIVATHGHFDHIGFAREVQEALKVPFAIHRDDLSLVEGLADAGALFGVKVGPPPEVTRFLAEGDEVRFGDETLRVLHTPGHSLGGVTLVRNNIAIVGDCLFAGSIGRTDMPGQSHDLLMVSIWDKLLTLDDATEVYPGHGPPTTIGQERSTNPFLR
ncbi:MAG: MBL fold metallo-hydrolase [Candidatus Latescibacteria bacterium]|nr:MBL fold metallo-hydrolase [Candidatus Latescibacterota bacterium]